jgi:hypothetical protein
VTFAGLATSEFENHARARSWARAALVLVLLSATGTVALAVERAYSPAAEIAMAMALTSASVALVGYLVRHARLRVDAQGVRWGWNIAGVRLSRERLTSAHVYEDAVAFEPRRGQFWYVSSRDWDRFDQIPGALARAQLPFSRRRGKAPLRARLQSYGRVLDGLLVLDLLLAVAGLMAALTI